MEMFSTSLRYKGSQIEKLLRRTGAADGVGVGFFVIGAKVGELEGFKDGRIVGITIDGLMVG
jgi:hypothetical protein